MLTLYKVRFYFRNDVRSLQPIIASAKNKTDAVRRARAFVSTQYTEKVVLDDAELICRTPDDVLDWS